MSKVLSLVQWEVTDEQETNAGVTRVVMEGSRASVWTRVELRGDPDGK